MIMLLIAIIVGFRNLVFPRPFYITKAALLERYSYPLPPDSIPTWIKPILALVPPAPVIILIPLFQGTRGWPYARHVYQLLISFVMCTLTAAAASNILKVLVGEPRPSFAALCWPDGEVRWHDHYPSGTQAPPTASPHEGYPKCSCSEELERYARDSFPSDHAAWIMAAWGFLTLYLFDVCGAFASGAAYAAATTPVAADRSRIRGKKHVGFSQSDHTQMGLMSADQQTGDESNPTAEIAAAPEGDTYPYDQHPAGTDNDVEEGLIKSNRGGERSDAFGSGSPSSGSACHTHFAAAGIRAWQVVVCLVPAFAACIVGVSRVMCYRHHPHDVIAGVLLGALLAGLFYWQVRKRKSQQPTAAP
eukprot:jgi/Chrzof1/2265/Cz11g09050.t1